MTTINSAASTAVTKVATYVLNGNSPPETISVNSAAKTSRTQDLILVGDGVSSDGSLPTVVPLFDDNQLTPSLDQLFQKILGDDAGNYSEKELLAGIRQAFLGTVLESPQSQQVTKTPAANYTAPTDYVRNSDYSVAKVYLALIQMTSVMSETNLELVDMQKSLVAVNTGLLKALEAKGEAQTQKLNDIHDHLQHVMNKIKKLGILGKLAVGLVSLASELAGCASAVATGNVASFGANAVAAWNSTAQVTAGTLFLTMDEANKLLDSTIGMEVNVGKSFLEDVQTSGFLFFAGDSAGAIAAEALTTAALTSGVLCELTMVVGMVKTATQTSVEVSMKIAQQLLKNFVTVASDAVGLGFHYSAMIKSFRDKDSAATNEIDAQTVTANFGAAMGLLMLILEKTSAVDGLATVLGDCGMGKDGGKMLSGYMLMIVMGLMKSRIAYGQYQDKQSFDALAQNATPSSLASKYQGSSLPPQLLASMDRSITKIADSFERVAGSNVVNHNSVRFMGACVTLLMFNMQMTNVVESCDSSLGSSAMQKATVETNVAKDLYAAQERLYESMISDSDEMSQNIGKVVVANLQLLENYYAQLKDSISTHSAI